VEVILGEEQKKKRSKRRWIKGKGKNPQCPARNRSNTGVPR